MGLMCMVHCANLSLMAATFLIITPGSIITTISITIFSIIKTTISIITIISIIITTISPIIICRELLAPDGILLKEGDILRRPTLADTLEKISERGFEYFYQSNMTRGMVEEINGLGGNYSFEDFANYAVIERNVTASSYMGFPLLSTPPPSAGAVLSMILSVLEGMTPRLQCR